MLKQLKHNKTTYYSLTLLLFISFIASIFTAQFSINGKNSYSKKGVLKTSINKIQNTVPKNINFIEATNEEELKEKSFSKIDFNNSVQAYPNFEVTISTMLSFDFNLKSQANAHSIPLYLKYHRLKINLL